MKNVESGPVRRPGSETMPHIEVEPRVRTEAELRRLQGLKWSHYGPEVLPAWVADMDLLPPDVVNQAIEPFMERRDYGYNFDVVRRLNPAFVRWQQRHHGWEPDLDDVYRFCDVLHAIDVTLWLHTKPGDGVVLLTPVYPPFISAVHGADRRLVSVPLDPDGWRLDPERLESGIDDSTTAILLCHPHNPTGRVFDQSEREAIAEVVARHDLLLISDEVWADLIHPGTTHVPMATVGDLRQRTVTISSASKAFNLAGLRCAVGHVGHRELARTFRSLPDHFLGAVSTPGALAALACWAEGEPWLAATRRFLTDRRDQLVRRVRRELPEVGFMTPEATYLAWLDLNAYGLDDPGRRLLEEANLAVVEGTDFGREGAGHVRLNTATSAAMLDAVVDRLSGFLTRAGSGESHRLDL